MVAELALQVEGLCKRYRIGGREAVPSSFSELLSATALRLVGRSPLPDRGERGGATDAWVNAVDDVSFTVRDGEAVGIIGRNGAGKSTLLKLLCRIAWPTAGWAEVYGRVGALLEVGTGFHGELTGRENVTLNGVMLGMKRTEVDKKIDAIVEFAGVERFIDTPVRKYSTGMRARLAFAIAAHVEPEILIVDEVLAVGDAEFQRRCLGRMADAARSGRTVLFVSHNMAAIEGLCQRVLWLDQGRLRSDGPASDVIAAYLATTMSASDLHEWPDMETAPGNDLVRLRRAEVRAAAGRGGRRPTSIDVQTPVELEFELWNLRPGARLNLSLHVYDEQGTMVFNALPTEERVWQGRPYVAGRYRDTCHIPADLLNDGLHRVELLVVEDSSRVIFSYEDILVFEVRDRAEGRGGWYGSWPGAVRPRLAWETELVEEFPADLAP
jgi:lipopolysaccharide transport system ATP-binding protein